MKKFNDMMMTIYWIAMLIAGAVWGIWALYENVKDRIDSRLRRAERDGYKEGWSDATENDEEKKANGRYKWEE